jgi:hypothetical protein
MRTDLNHLSWVNRVVSRAALLVVLGFLLVAATNRSTTSVNAGESRRLQPAPPSQPPPTRQYSPSFTIGGLVAAPRTITLEDLQALPSEEISVEFISGGSVEQRTYRSVLPYDLLMAAEPQFDLDRRNDMLRWYVTVSAHRRLPGRDRLGRDRSRLRGQAGDGRLSRGRRAPGRRGRHGAPRRAWRPARRTLCEQHRPHRRSTGGWTVSKTQPLPMSTLNRLSSWVLHER